MEKTKIGLNNNQLKIIAMLAMLSDHIGRMLLPEYKVLIIIGRLAFPIFAFMIAEGCFYTKNKLKYFLSIACLGTGCQAVYLFTTGSLYQNVLITFSLSVAIIFGIENFKKKKDLLSVVLIVFLICAVVFTCQLLPKILSGFKIDYGLIGVSLPVLVYLTKGNNHKVFCAAVVLVALSFTMDITQWFSLLAVPVLLLYNGKRGKHNLKLLFYIFYPAHLAIIYFADVLIDMLL